MAAQLEICKEFKFYSLKFHCPVSALSLLTNDQHTVSELSLLTNDQHRENNKITIKDKEQIQEKPYFAVQH